MKKLSKIFAVVLVLALALSMLPMGAAAASNWTEVTDLSALAATDMVAITSTKDGATYAMLNNDTKGPLVAFDSASTEATQAMLWNFVAVTGGYKIKPMDNASEWLYCINDNNGLRIGNTETGSVWATTDYGFLKATDAGNNDRNFGIYFNGTTANNWRCYKVYTGGSAPAASNGFSGQTIKFWKWTGAKPGAAAINEGTIAEALAADNGTKWTVSGVVNLVDGQNIYIQDATGAICARLAEASDAISVGDTITATGSRGAYNGMPQLTSCTFAAAATPITPFAAKATTLAGLTAADICTVVKIEGLTITEIYDNDGAWANPNITMTDGTNTIQLYKAVVSGDLEVNDIVTVTAVVGKKDANTYRLYNVKTTDVVVTGTAAPGESTGAAGATGTQAGTNPDTGDTTAIVSMTAVMALAVTVLAVLVIGNKKKMF